MYNKKELFEKEKKDLLKTIEMDHLFPGGYYYLAKYYQRTNDYIKVVHYFKNTLAKLSNKIGDYYIPNINRNQASCFGDCEVSIEEVYIELGNIYKDLKELDLMCEEYKEACDLGDCEMFNKNCK